MLLEPLMLRLRISLTDHEKLKMMLHILIIQFEYYGVQLLAIIEDLLCSVYARIT